MEPMQIVGEDSFLATLHQDEVNKIVERHPKAFAEVQYHPDNPMVCDFQLKPEFKDHCVMARGYPMAQVAIELIQRQVDDLQSKGFIEEVPGDQHPQVLAPAFLVPKADGTKRFVVDYSKLNKLCAPCALPLPLMDVLLENLARCKYKSKMDLQHGFWQVKLTDKAKQLTSFILPNQAV